MNTWLLDLRNRLTRQDTRNARARKRYEAQARALEYLLKMRTPIHRLFSAAPLSLKKSAGFRLAQENKHPRPHQGAGGKKLTLIGERPVLQLGPLGSRCA